MTIGVSFGPIVGLCIGVNFFDYRMDDYPDEETACIQILLLLVAINIEFTYERHD